MCLFHVYMPDYRDSIANDEIIVAFSPCTCEKNKQEGDHNVSTHPLLLISISLKGIPLSVNKTLCGFQNNRSHDQQ